MSALFIWCECPQIVEILKTIHLQYKVLLIQIDGYPEHGALGSMLATVDYNDNEEALAIARVLRTFKNGKSDNYFWWREYMI